MTSEPKFVPEEAVEISPDGTAKLRVPGGYHGEGVVGNVDGQGDVFVGDGGVQEVVVVAGQEQAPADAFSHPLLMEHQAVVVGDPQVEEGRFAGDH